MHNERGINRHHSLNKKGLAATSVFSFVFSFLASSHHWLHMGVLLLLGGSTNMMAAMSGVLWLRRIMVIASMVTILISLYRLYKHRCKSGWVIALTAVSAAVSLGFLLYTLLQFGW